MAAALFHRTRELRQRDDRHAQLLRQRLQAARDLRDLLHAILDLPGAAKQLEVVDHHQAQPVLRLEAAAFRAHFHDEVAVDPTPQFLRQIKSAIPDQDADPPPKSAHK